MAAIIAPSATPILALSLKPEEEEEDGEEMGAFTTVGTALGARVVTATLLHWLGQPPELQIGK